MIKPFMEYSKGLAVKGRTEIESWMAHSQWGDVALLERRDEVGRLIEEALAEGSPLAVGKVGANEQVVLRWAKNFPIQFGIYQRRLTFWNTRFSLTNAGLRPRTEKSYTEFADILEAAISVTDILGVWKTLDEYRLYTSCSFHGKICTFFDFDPWFMATPWSQALKGKRVFVVSPFLRLFAAQMENRESIWPQGREVLPDFSLCGFEFPYLTEPDCELSWKTVWDAVLTEMDQVEFDVVLTGCGALGLPLVAEAKRRGKIGIHLGGMLQILFGIRGKRYDDSPQYSALINDAWVRPPENFRPKGFQTIEDGCYW